jgi:hypothetical protein
VSDEAARRKAVAELVLAAERKVQAILIELADKIGRHGMTLDSVRVDGRRFSNLRVEIHVSPDDIPF